MLHSWRQPENPCHCQPYNPFQLFFLLLLKDNNMITLCIRHETSFSSAFNLSGLPTRIRLTANMYAAQLEICTQQPNSASTIHAHMITSGFKPRGHILNRLIDMYTKSNKLLFARQLFDQIPNPDIVVRTTLITAHSNAGDLGVARTVFDTTPINMRDVVSYNAMISGCARNADGYSALSLFLDMKRISLRPDDFTFTSVLSGLAMLINHEKHCQQFHCEVMKSGVVSVVSVSNALISVYMKCSSWSFPDPAHQLFGEMPEKDELTWTTVITGYVKRGDLNAAKELFDGMVKKIDVAWNAMISGYVHHGFISEAFETFRKMFSVGITLDEFTYTSILSACANAGLLKHGKQVHAFLLRTDPVSEPEWSLPVKNALITLYSKCAKLDAAMRVFDEMPMRDLVSWNAFLSAYISAGRINDARQLFKKMTERNLLSWTVMISGLAQNGCGEEALKLLNQMNEESVRPCDYAFAGAFTACASLGALENGRQLHSQLIQFGYESSLSASNALMTMYARCGTVEDAHCVFLTMPTVDSVSWNAMIAALGQHGHGVQALELFELMLSEGILPDRITFLTVLSACSHAGLVSEGCRYFELMHSIYGIAPGVDHYARLIDLLGRAGKILEAKNVIDKMPFEPDPPTWEALLAGCRIHGNMEVGIFAAERLFELTPQHDGTYVLLSNMYAAVGRWNDVARVRQLMKDRGVKKEPGCSWIEVANKVHVFLVGDTVHHEVQEVYKFLEILGVKMKKMGYVPDTKYALHDVESEQKEYNLSTHSEKLAVAFGLLKLPMGAAIRVLKNLRICGDCHTAIMFMSKAVDREIVVRDGKRFHHFRDGECSCGNYW